MTEEEKQEAQRLGKLMPRHRCVSKTAVGRGLVTIPKGVGKAYYKTPVAGVDIPPVKLPVGDYDVLSGNSTA